MASAPSPSPAPSSSSSSSTIPVQPDHFYPSPHARVDVRSPGDDQYLHPDEDPSALRGIPVFKPTWEEFKDFEAYVTSIEPWGRISGIVKVIPPSEWKDSLPSVVPQLSGVKLRNPIAQEMVGRSGLFRQSNIEKRKVFSIREWAELCQRDTNKTPSPVSKPRAKESKAGSRRRKRDTSVEADEQNAIQSAETAMQSPQAASTPLEPNDAVSGTPIPVTPLESVEEPPLDDKFLADFKPETSWLPPDTKAEDYTPEACRELERNFWRTIGNGGVPALYGADMKGSLFTNATSEWNVASLPSLLSRLLAHAHRKVPGVNTPYLYFGMWRAAFAWHVEDMDLYSINYIHFGAPKVWWAIPSERASAFERVMKGYFPGDAKVCSQFLRHKSYLVSPTILADNACRPNTLVQHQGEFVITFPYGYHAGINLGLNCAESVNFALNGWEDICRKADWCNCESDSVKLDIDGLLSAAAEAEARHARQVDANNRPRKRKTPDGAERAPKRARLSEAPCAPIKVRVKFSGPPPVVKSCCLCPSLAPEGLLPVHDVPLSLQKGQRDGDCWAHQSCAMVIPETWVDSVDGVDWVFGVDVIEKARWDLKCAACTKPSSKAHGAKIQCTRGKCPRAYHVSCAKAREDVLYREVELVENQVLLTSWTPDVAPDNQLKLNEEAEPALNMPERPEPTGEASEAVPKVIKTTKKLVVEVLCPAHNPEMRQIVKQRKDEIRRRNVLALKEGDRIRVRISSGVFEVSLLRVNAIEENVEVEWSTGARRAVKWGSILWGSKSDAPTPMAHDYAAPASAPPLATASNQRGASHTAFGNEPAIHNSWSQLERVASPAENVQPSYAQPAHYPNPPPQEPSIASFRHYEEGRDSQPTQFSSASSEQTYNHRHTANRVTAEERWPAPREPSYGEFWNQFRGSGYDVSRDSGHATWYNRDSERRSHDGDYHATWSTSSPQGPNNPSGYTGYLQESHNPRFDGDRGQYLQQQQTSVQYAAPANQSHYRTYEAAIAYPYGTGLGAQRPRELHSGGERLSSAAMALSSRPP